MFISCVFFRVLEMSQKGNKLPDASCSMEGRLQMKMEASKVRSQFPSRISRSLGSMAGKFPVHVLHDGDARHSVRASRAVERLASKDFSAGTLRNVASCHVAS